MPLPRNWIWLTADDGTRCAMHDPRPGPSEGAVVWTGGEAVPWGHAPGYIEAMAAVREANTAAPAVEEAEPGEKPEPPPSLGELLEAAALTVDGVESVDVTVHKRGVALVVTPGNAEDRDVVLGLAWTVCRALMDVIGDARDLTVRET